MEEYSDIYVLLNIDACYMNNLVLSSFKVPSIELPSFKVPSFQIPSFEMLGFPKFSKRNFNSLSVSYPNLPAIIKLDNSHETLYQSFQTKLGSDATISNSSTVITSDISETQPFSFIDNSFNVEITFSDHPLVTISRISQLYHEMSEKKDLNSRERDHVRKLKSCTIKHLEQVESQISTLNSKKTALESRLDDINLKESLILENITLLEERMEYWETQITKFEGKLLVDDTFSDFQIELVIYIINSRKLLHILILLIL